MLGKEISAYLLLRGEPLKPIIQVRASVICSQLLSGKLPKRIRRHQNLPAAMRPLCVLPRRAGVTFTVAAVVFRRLVIALMVFNGFQEFLALSRGRTPLLFFTGFFMDNLHHSSGTPHGTSGNHKDWLRGPG